MHVDVVLTNFFSGKLMVTLIKIQCRVPIYCTFVTSAFILTATVLYRGHSFTVFVNTVKLYSWEVGTAREAEAFLTI